MSAIAARTAAAPIASPHVLQFDAWNALLATGVMNLAAGLAFLPPAQALRTLPGVPKRSRYLLTVALFVALFGAATCRSAPGTAAARPRRDRQDLVRRRRDMLWLASQLHSGDDGLGRPGIRRDLRGVVADEPVPLKGRQRDDPQHDPRRAFDDDEQLEKPSAVGGDGTCPVPRVPQHLIALPLRQRVPEHEDPEHDPDGEQRDRHGSYRQVSFLPRFTHWPPPKA